MTAAHTNAIELAAACGPRPQLLISVGSDSTADFPQVGFPFIKKKYALAGADDAVKNLHLPDEDHDFGPTKRKAIYEFFARHLHLVANEFAAPEKAAAASLQALSEDLDRLTIEPPERMTVFTAERPRPDHAVSGSESVAKVFRTYLQQLRSAGKPVATPEYNEVLPYAFKAASDHDETLIFTPPGFDKPGVPRVAQGSDTATLQISVIDKTTQRPTHCRINVVGPDGNYYEPGENELRQFSLTGEWPAFGWGNRKGKAPIRYLGRFFYSNGTAEVQVPAGTVRVEVWKGFEYRPTTVTTNLLAGQSNKVTVPIEQTVAMNEYGYTSGDAHIHIQRLDEDDDRRVLALMQAEDIHFGSILAYNEPAGPYSGFMKRMDAPQRKGTGAASTSSDGQYVIQSGQEYRSSSFGHINFYLLDELVMPGQDNNADNWPPFGHVSQLVRDSGGVSFYAHGGYAKEIYADVVQGNVDGVELLQFGVYRGIGLTHWYHMLNAGFRVPAMGACDYPACRKLGDCKTYVFTGDTGAKSVGSVKPEYGAEDFAKWTQKMAGGHSFFTNGPLVLFTVNCHPPGEQIKLPNDATTVTAKVKVRSEVAPVTHVQLIGNGRVLHEIEVPKSQGQGNWIEFEFPIEVARSTWIAARAFALSVLGSLDSEAHTNPVYIYRNEKAPYEQKSLDVLVTAIDSQITFHKKRKFEEQARVIAYFEKSRDILMKIRENGGAASTVHPSDVSVTQAMIDNPGKLQHTEAELQEFLKPLPPKPMTEVLNSFETVDGFEMQLVASEPLVNDPIAACFDENGNLYVCEMRDYPYKPAEGGTPLGTVRLLRDTNGDGKFDESHVFADNLLWAGGVAPWKGGVYVAAAPDIWYLKDTDGDHKADIRRKVYSGFGLGNQQAMLNNLTWWLDHRIYGSTAGNGGTVSYADSKLAGNDPISVNGRDFRFQPVDDRFESITGTVQFGTTFDDWGNRFLCSESRPLLHAVLPQHYLERNPFLPVPYGLQNLTNGAVPCFRISPLERWRMIRSSRRIAHGARAPDAAGASHHVIDAAAGVTIYCGGAYPSRYYGNIFIGGAQNNLIHRRTLSPAGVTFTSKRSDPGTEFIRSSDNWFRPVNFMNAPDGTLYVLDMSREILETIHVPLDVTKFVDFRSGRQQGRIYRIAPADFKYPGSPALGNASTAELVQHLQSPHGWYRHTAHRLIYERQDKTAIPPLRKLLRESKQPQARLHALYSLNGLSREALTEDDLKFALQDPHPRVREHAMRLSEPILNRSSELLTMVVSEANSEDERLRFQAAFSLGETDAPSAALALSKLARKFGSDAWMRTAILSSSNKLSASMLAEMLQDQSFALSSSGEAFLTKLAVVIGSRNDAQDIDATLTFLAETSAPQRPLARRLLRELGHALRSAGKRFHEERLSITSARYVRHIRNEAESMLKADTASDASRIEAIDWLSCWPLPVVGESLQAEFRSHHSDAVQLAFVEALATYSDVAVAAYLIRRWPDFSPTLKQKSLRVLLSRNSWLPLLLQAVQSNAVSPAAISMAERETLLRHHDAAIASLAAETFAAQEESGRGEVVRRYESALRLPGDADQGRRIFKRDCSACHRIGNVGHVIGPDLTSSSAKDPQALLTHILDPNRYVLPTFETYLVLDTNGRSHTGMIAAQTATSVTLKQPENKTRTILRGNIEEMLSTKKSLMPEGFEKKMTQQEMAHLLKFLQSSKQPATTSKPTLHIGTLPGLIEPEG